MKHILLISIEIITSLNNIGRYFTETWCRKVNCTIRKGRNTFHQHTLWTQMISRVGHRGQMAVAYTLPTDAAHRR